MSKRGEIKRKIYDLKWFGYGKPEVMAQIAEFEKELEKYPPQHVAANTSGDTDQSAADDMIDHWNSQY